MNPDSSSPHHLLELPNACVHFTIKNLVATFSGPICWTDMHHDLYLGPKKAFSELQLRRILCGAGRQRYMTQPIRQHPSVSLRNT